MKKFSKILVLILIINSTILPILPVVAAPKTAQPIRLRWAVSGTALIWDDAHSLGYSPLEWYSGHSGEFLYGLNLAYDRGLSAAVPKEDTWQPILATSWEVDMWPEKMNSKNWTNRGGYANITYTLRKGVDFHDGMPWNASVAKWNIDRAFVISGNLTGKGNTAMQDTFWADADEWVGYYTEDWNKSEYIGQYGWYYDPATDTNYTNPGYAPLGKYPLVKQVVVVEPGDPYGGKFRIEFNDWNAYGMGGIGLLQYWSQHTYQDYFEQGVFGWDNDVKHSDNPTIVKHMVGTGPYIYESHDEIAGKGLLVKNYNYWNRTNLENLGWYDIDYVDTVWFPSDLGGAADRNNALLSHAVDGGVDSYWEHFDYVAITTDPVFSANIKWVDRPEEDFIHAITLNCINETWYCWDNHYNAGPFTNYSYNFGTTWYFATPYPAGNRPSGLPRALRKAINYAFDYDTYINVGLKGRAVRAGGILGVTNLYYNASIPQPYYNVTIAREALLTNVDDPYTQYALVNFSQLCKDRLLDENSTDLDWRWVADNNPIWKLDFYWDPRPENLALKSKLEENLRDIGVALKDPFNDDGYHIVDPYMWTDVSTYWAYTAGFPVFSAQAWPLDWNVPDKTPEGYVSGQLTDPNYGSWRTNPYAPYGGLPYMDWWYAFPYFSLSFGWDSDFDEWTRHMWLSNDSARFEWFGKMANIMQNEVYPRVSISQHKGGWAYWRQWNLSEDWPDPVFHLIDYVEEFVVTYPPIPGVPVAMVLTVSVAVIIGVLYITMRKKKIV